ncbi:DNA primase [Persicobacter diffluens]|uniref:DNA primase n=1 Tax=Persicobacter diffluens TaxID=981 RepID=A0AAN4VYH2_9BACT|nr:DNA primase [Persicobacter diffluens]
MGISQNTVQQVKDRMDIVEVVGDYVPLKKKGNNMWACCPFHEEKTPSFSVAPGKGIYKCFGCGKTGDSIRFVMELEGMEFPEAIRHLAQKYGIPIEETKLTEEVKEKISFRERLHSVMHYAKELFAQQLWENKEGRAIGYSYLRERGLTDEIIKTFELGYSLDKWEAFYNSAKKVDFTTPEMEGAGLVIVKEDGKKIFDRFRARVMFPVHDLSGKVIAFGARTLSNNKKEAKYLNSPETEIYHKSRVLYGIYQAKDRIRKEDNCYLVEGYTDVISMHMAGVENVVASSGTSLTEDQIRLIKRFTNNITVLYDGDAAGVKASLRGISMILAGGLDVQAVAFPEGEDPDSYIRKIGPNAFGEYLKDHQTDFISFITEVLLADVGDDPLKKTKAAREILEAVAQIPDAIKRDVYLKASAQKLGIAEEALQQELQGIFEEQQKRAHRNYPSAGSQPPMPSQVPGYIPDQDLPPEAFLPPEEMYPELGQSQTVEQVALGDRDINLLMLHEREVVRMLLVYGILEIEAGRRVADYIQEEISSLDIYEMRHAQIVNVYFHRMSLEQDISPQAMLTAVEGEALEVLEELVEMKYSLSQWMDRHQINVPMEQDNLGNNLYKAIINLKVAHFSLMEKQLEQQLEQNQAQANEEGMMETLQMMVELQQMKKQAQDETRQIRYKI